MKLPFIARRDAEIADLRRQLGEVEGKRRNLARWLAEATADNKRLVGRNRELSRRLDSAHDANLGELGDIALLEARAQRLEDELAAARAETDVKVAAAEERGRQAGRAMTPQEWEGRPVDGAPAARREPPTELRRALDRCRGLADQLSALQTSHVADTRELHDLRQREARP